MKPKMLDLLAHFVMQRERARVGKELGRPKPWTSDPIIQQYRFCNINRCDDTVTRWIMGNTVPEFKDFGHPELWFRLVYGRLFNNPATLGILNKIPLWRPLAIKRVLGLMKESKSRIFNAAYIVSTNGRKMDKVDYLLEQVLQPLWDARGDAPVESFSCQAWYDFLVQFQGLGDFMVNQIITDMRYTPILDWEWCFDWSSFVVAGPGTKRGLNRLHGRPVKQGLNQKKASKEILKLQEWLTRRFAETPHMAKAFRDPNNPSNCMCEFDKYCRAYFGEGKPKQKYQGEK